MNSLFSSFIKTQSKFCLTQVADFSKYISKSRAKRLPLTTKRVGKGFKKGNGCRSEGRITRKGRFIIDREKCTELVVPDFKGFLLKPYIGPGALRGFIDIPKK